MSHKINCCLDVCKLLVIKPLDKYSIGRHRLVGQGNTSEVVWLAQNLKSESLLQYLSQYLTNLMHKICFTISFISCLYIFRSHVLIIRRSKLHYTASGIITPIGMMIPVMTQSNLHTVHTAYDPAPHNDSQQNQCRTPHAVIHDLVLLMMGIMMPETC